MHCIPHTLCIDTSHNKETQQTGVSNREEVLFLSGTNSLFEYYLLTYLLTSCSRVLLEKLTGSKVVKKFHAFYGTRRFITAFAKALHLSLS
jgi:hypothetical protein